MIKDITLEYFISKKQQQALDIMKKFIGTITQQKEQEIKETEKQTAIDLWNNLNTNGLDIGTLTKYIIKGKIVEYNDEFMFYCTQDKRLYNID